MSAVSFAQVSAAGAFVDDVDVVERSRSDMALRFALEGSRPRNWWGTGASDSLLNVARAEGLPLYGVPRAGVISALSAAANEQERLNVLGAHQVDILHDCQAALDACTDGEVANDVALANAALAAMRQGHHESAMALAVSMSEPLARWAATPRTRAFSSQADHDRYKKLRPPGKSSYKWADIEISEAWVDDQTGKVHGSDFKYQVLIAPLSRFFTPFFGNAGEIAPVGLSRHVVAHQATVKHFSKTNALLSMMLVNSILIAQQEWAEEIAGSERFD